MSRTSNSSLGMARPRQAKPKKRDFLAAIDQEFVGSAGNDATAARRIGLIQQLLKPEMAANGDAPGRPLLGSISVEDVGDPSQLMTAVPFWRVSPALRKPG